MGEHRLNGLYYFLWYKTFVSYRGTILVIEFIHKYRRFRINILVVEKRTCYTRTNTHSVYTYTECVFVALVMQHVYYSAICGQSGSIIFSTLSLNGKIFGQNFSTQFFFIFFINLLKKIPHSKNNSEKCFYRSKYSLNVPVIRVSF